MKKEINKKEKDERENKGRSQPSVHAADDVYYFDALSDDFDSLIDSGGDFENGLDLEEYRPPRLLLTVDLIMYYGQATSCQEEETSNQNKTTTNLESAGSSRSADSLDFALCRTSIGSIQVLHNASPIPILETSAASIEPSAIRCQREASPSATC